MRYKNIGRQQETHKMILVKVATNNNFFLSCLSFSRFFRNDNKIFLYEPKQHFVFKKCHIKQHAWRSSEITHPRVCAE